MRIFKLYPETVRQASDDRLRRIIGALDTHHIALGLETPVLVRFGTCASGVAKTPWMVDMVARLKSLGARLDYLAMVGPLVDGHVKRQASSCHVGIDEVAEDATRTMNLMRRYYPDLVVGDIEPLARREDYPSMEDLAVWFDAFARQAGRPLGFFHADVTWSLPWQHELAQVARSAAQAAIPFGVIYNGNGDESDDATYAADTLTHARSVEAVLTHAPDQVVFQSWDDRPHKVLPVDQPFTMTDTVRRYLDGSVCGGLRAPHS